MATATAAAEKPPLKILSLAIHNLMRVVAVEITPDGDVITISGANEQGKSSVINAIWIGLGGAAAVPDMPIRKGEKEGFLEMNLGGEYVVRRVFTIDDDGTLHDKLTVRGADGHRLSSAQTILNGLRSKYTIDATLFDRMKPEEQFEALKRFVPNVDFAAIAKAHDDDYKARTDVNRDAKALAAQVAAIVIPADAPKEKVDEAALITELEEVGKHNTDRETRKANRERAAADIEHHRKNAAVLRDRAVDLRAQADSCDREAEEHDAKAANVEERLAQAGPLPEPKDTAEIRARLDAAKAANALVDLRARRDALAKQRDELEAKSDALTAAIEKRQADKLKKISEAKLPVPGLEFGDGILLLNGVPLSQASSAQRLRTSIAIAMAENPRLRILRAEVSLLDRKSRKILEEMARAHNYQVWAEKMDETGQEGFVIEDGRVASTPESRAQQQAAE